MRAIAECAFAQHPDVCAEVYATKRGATAECTLTDIFNTVRQEYFSETSAAECRIGNTYRACTHHRLHTGFRLYIADILVGIKRPVAYVVNAVDRRRIHVAVEKSVSSDGRNTAAQSNGRQHSAIEERRFGYCRYGIRNGYGGKTYTLFKRIFTDDLQPVVESDGFKIGCRHKRRFAYLENASSKCHFRQRLTVTERTLSDVSYGVGQLD